MTAETRFRYDGMTSFRNDEMHFEMTVPSSSFRNRGDLPLIITKITIIFIVIKKIKWGIKKCKNISKSFRNYIIPKSKIIF